MGGRKDPYPHEDQSTGVDESLYMGASLQSEDAEQPTEEREGESSVLNYGIQPVRVLYRTEKGGQAPVYGSETAAGCDIFATEELILMPPTVVGVAETGLAGEEGPAFCDVSLLDPSAVRHEVRHHPVVVSTGLFVAMPPGVDMHIRDRSGLGFKFDVMPFNGTIDSDYRGEIKVKVWNDGSQPYKIEVGHRIAQAVFTHVLRAEFEEVEQLPPSGRMDGGLGHTGK